MTYSGWHCQINKCDLRGDRKQNPREFIFLEPLQIMIN